MLAFESVPDTAVSAPLPLAPGDAGNFAEQQVLLGFRRSCTDPSSYPLECIGVQTIPVLLPKRRPALAVCDFEDVVAKAEVELQKLQAFSGNGMNAACVGKLIMFVLAGTSWRPR